MKQLLKWTIPSNCLEYPSNHSEKNSPALHREISDVYQSRQQQRTDSLVTQPGADIAFENIAPKTPKAEASLWIPPLPSCTPSDSLALLFSIVMVLYFLNDRETVICQQGCFTPYHSLLTQDQCSGQQQAWLLFLKIHQLLCWRVWM